MKTHKLQENTIKKRAGFTLLEVLLVIVMLIIALFPLVQILSSGLLAGAESEATASAINLAQQKMEEVKNTSFSEIQNVSKQAFPGFPEYSFEITVTAPQINLKDISVIVYWMTTGGEASVTLQTLILNE